MFTIRCILGGMFLGATLFWMAIPMPLWYGYYGIGVGILFIITLLPLYFKTKRNGCEQKPVRH
jgi:hypothetical protein